MGGRLVPRDRHERGERRGLVALEDAMPVWLLEYLLLARAPPVAVVNLQLALLPGEDTLPELVNP